MTNDTMVTCTLHSVVSLLHEESFAVKVLHDVLVAVRLQCLDGNWCAVPGPIVNLNIGDMKTAKKLTNTTWPHISAQTKWSTSSTVYIK